MRFPLIVGSLILMALTASPARAEVKLSSCFSDGMVLQRDAAVAVWGTAAAGETVSVSIADRSKTVAADSAGNWKLHLEPLQVAEGLTLIVAGKNVLTIRDVAVGDVWIGSGQSNMAMNAESYVATDPELATLAAGSYPRIRLLGGPGQRWRAAKPAENARFSAMLLVFGVRLQRELNVPIGLISAAVNGTQSGRWVTKDMLSADESCRKAIETFEKEHPFDERLRRHEAELERWKQAVAEAKQTGKREPLRPAAPTKPSEMVGVGDLYQVYMRPLESYTIRGLLWDQGESGSGLAALDQLTTMRALIQGWRTARGRGNFPFLYVQKPSGLGCAFDPQRSLNSQSLPFAPLPKSVPDLASGLEREVYARLMDHPETFLVTTSDLVAGGHPHLKYNYAERAAQVALRAVYGRTGEYCGPRYRSHVIEDDAIRVTFDHVGEGLTHRGGGKLQGFSLAGADGLFHWADAEIQGDSVMVSSAAVAKPVAVRYAWGQVIPWANLFNQDGFPALTFRTDRD